MRCTAAYTTSACILPVFSHPGRHPNGRHCPPIPLRTLCFTTRVVPHLTDRQIRFNQPKRTRLGASGPQVNTGSCRRRTRPEVTCCNKQRPGTFPSLCNQTPTYRLLDPGDITTPLTPTNPGTHGFPLGERLSQVPPCRSNCLPQICTWKPRPRLEQPNTLSLSFHCCNHVLGPGDNLVRSLVQLIDHHSKSHCQAWNASRRSGTCPSFCHESLLQRFDPLHSSSLRFLYPARVR